MANLGETRIPARGIPISAIGFAIGCTSMLVALIFHNDRIANYMFFAGFAVIIVSILLVIYDVIGS